MTIPIIENAFTLSFDTTNIPPAQGPADSSELAAEELMNRMVARGFVAFQLEWLNEFSAQLAIEDDVIFLCEAVNELRSFEENGAPHSVHRGDGELEVTSTLTAGVVYIEAVHTPHLDYRFRREYAFEVSLAGYLQAWRFLIRDLWSKV